MENSNDTYTFTDIDATFRFTVKKAFLQVCPDPAAVPRPTLFVDLKMAQYLHNPVGPAITVLASGYEEQWLDGKQVTNETGSV